MIVYDKFVMSHHDQLYGEIDNLYTKHENTFVKAWAACDALASGFSMSNMNDRTSRNDLLNILKDANIIQLIHEKFGKAVTVDAWMNKYYNCTFQEPHTHGSYEPHRKNLMSFVYFFDVPDDEPLFYFIDGGESRYINEQTGDVIFFDPSFTHGVDFNTSNTLRRTIAGNVVVEV